MTLLSRLRANRFSRLHACKSFKKSGTELCNAVAVMARKLCTEYVDPTRIEALLSNRLIPLDKWEGAVRPIGIGEALRRIIAKCITRPNLMSWWTQVARYNYVQGWKVGTKQRFMQCETSTNTKLTERASFFWSTLLMPLMLWIDQLLCTISR